MLTLNLSSILVDDQDKALAFYTDVLGFVKKTEIPLGEFRWLTVIASHGQPDIELVLEPTAFPPAKTYQAALFEAAIPLTAVATDDIDAECRRLTARGVVFRGEPQESGSAKSVMFEDTCGNLINLYQVL